jgi:hypothetical protein
MRGLSADRPEGSPIKAVAPPIYKAKKNHENIVLKIIISAYKRDGLVAVKLEMDQTHHG